MKTKIKDSSFKGALLGAMLLTASLSSAPANAQARIQGKFTLPFETRWGQAVLPAGEYELRFAPSDMPAVLVIRDVKSGRPVAYESVGIPEGAEKGPSALVVGTRGTERVVYSLRIAEFGESFVYERPPARRRAIGEAHQTQVIPVLVANK